MPAVFDDMSKLKTYHYFAVTRFGEKPLSYYSLKDKSGIYMLTNKITKKFYIGMSKNLKARLYSYLDINRLLQNNSSRIHKALLKYGHENFSVSILELFEAKTGLSPHLKEREDYYIKLFKPQYNIARSSFNIDYKIYNNSYIKLTQALPLKIKNLLNLCLDPANLDYHLVSFNYNPRRRFYYLAVTAPKFSVKANSLGWFEGNITKPCGYEVVAPLNRRSPSSFYEYLIHNYKNLIDKEKLALFFIDQPRNFVNDSIKKKSANLKKLLKIEKEKEKGN